MTSACIHHCLLPFAGPWATLHPPQRRAPQAGQGGKSQAGESAPAPGAALSTA